MGPNSLHALDRVPSGVAPCADLLEPHLSISRGSVFTIEIGSVFEIGTITRRIRKSRHLSEPFIGCSQGFHWQLTGWIKALAFGTASSAIDSLISSQAHRPCLFPALVIDASKRLRAFGQFVSLSGTSPHEA
jgi:hypothetical protein